MINGYRCFATKLLLAAVARVERHAQGSTRPFARSHGWLQTAAGSSARRRAAL